MWLVRLALRRPYTIAVSCLLIMILGVLSLTRMTVDIFPVIDIPVVAVVWIYPGLSAQDRELNLSRYPELGCCEFTFSLELKSVPPLPKSLRYRARSCVLRRRG